MEKNLWHSSLTQRHELSGRVEKGKNLNLWCFSSDKLKKYVHFNETVSEAEEEAESQQGILGCVLSLEKFRKIYSI